MQTLSAALLAAILAIAPIPAQAQGFVGAGSTFAQPILARWGQAFSNLQGEGGAAFAADGGLDYEPIGSTGGISRVLQGAADFGATDVPLPPEEVARHGLLQFPFVTGGVAIVTNLPGIAGGTLRLNGPVLARIYLGEAARWNDPAIRALNPAAPLPDAPIAVLRREDASGTTYHFAAYLAAADAGWRDRIGVDTQLRWPTGVAARGNRALAERVQATPNAIGYVEASQAARLGLAVALMENRAGRFVAPGLASLQAASATASWSAAQHFHQVQAAPSAADAYPITATVFALMPRNPPSRSRARQAVEFFRMALTERGGDAVALGFVPLPEAVVREVTGYWRAGGF